ncbi:hypothetical protein MTR67_018074 [Solanum verrucosum]|uniref:Uncharacterized protein n=1 Tax=Solanum verrucosum TaxID=315347 RepID=A0AAF0QJ30_SOLVR|nr:hypothetical protein MTR67_018074 [Solanum verrucosum]
MNMCLLSLQSLFSKEASRCYVDASLLHCITSQATLPSNQPSEALHLGRGHLFPYCTPRPGCGVAFVRSALPLNVGLPSASSDLVGLQSIAVRDKLESLCRELQRQNKVLMEECKRVSSEGQNLRLDLSNKFQDAIKEMLGFSYRVFLYCLMKVLLFCLSHSSSSNVLRLPPAGLTTRYHHSFSFM